MYWYGLITTLLGKSVLAVRFGAALFSLIGPLFVSLFLRNIAKVKSWWLGFLLLAFSPAFYLHSRTAFETTLATSLLASTIYFYACYRYKSRGYLLPLAVSFFFGFFSYSNAQLVFASLGVFLAASDLLYHYRSKKTLVIGALLGLLILSPAVKFSRSNTGGFAEHLSTINSYLVDPKTSVKGKSLLFVQHYWKGIRPHYWFYYQENDNIPRHLMKWYGFIPFFALPFMLLGLIICLFTIKQSYSRVILISLLVSPLGGTLAEVTITRILFYVVPATLLATIGFDWLVGKLGLLIHSQTITKILFWGVTIFFLWWGVRLTFVSVSEGPLWFPQYGLYWMQYGAQPLFSKIIPEWLDSHPDRTITISSNWANAPERFFEFFLTKDQQSRVFFRSLDYFSRDYHPLPNTDHVFTAEEYKQLTEESTKFEKVVVNQVLKYPNGAPGFYFVSFQYTPTAEAIINTESLARKLPVSETLVVNGENISLTYSPIAFGQIINLFDGKKETIVRGLEANPWEIKVNFPQPKTIGKIIVSTGKMRLKVTISGYTDFRSQPIIVNCQTPTEEYEPILACPISGTFSQVKIEITNMLLGNYAENHIYEIEIK